LQLIDRPAGSSIALEDAGHAVPFRDLCGAVRRRAAGLVAAGVSAGDRVVVIAGNSAAAVELYLACALIGAIWVGINPGAPDTERRRQCGLVRPALIVADDPGLAAAGTTVTTPDLLARAGVSVGGFPSTGPSLETPCAIAFTSGTTADPKPVVHSRAAVSLTAAATAAAHLQPADRVGIILPLSIHNVMIVGPMAALLAGATTVTVAKLNAPGVAAACHTRRLSTLSALVPATIYDLVHDKSIAPTALSSLRSAGAGAANLAEELRTAFESKFGVPLRSSYGMTEAPGVLCLETARAPHVTGGSGRPLPHVVVRARDGRGKVLPPGRQGRLCVYPAADGPFAGMYAPPSWNWSDSGLVRHSVTKKQLATDDFGSVDADGTVRVSARESGLIVRGGVSVNAGELESVLGEMPGVRAAAVTGEPDERLGERIIAFIELADGATASAQTLRSQAQSQLSHGKVPDEFVVVETLPRNAMGKVARSLLIR
jgi:acyl-coenzyme A synthetase/AMP-(fatty) acid ligase